MATGRRPTGILLVLLGLGLLVYAAFQGDLRVGLFLIIPYAYGTGILPFLGFTLLIVGAFLWMTAGFERVHLGGPGYEQDSRAYRGDDPRAPNPTTYRDDPRDAHHASANRGVRTERRVKHGGFVLLGPIPIVWGNDKRMLPWLILLGLGILTLMLLLPMLL